MKSEFEGMRNNGRQSKKGQGVGFNTGRDDEARIM